jgi:hypothetical protein
MRRLARHLLTVCTALSLVLCAATVALWVRSYHVADLVFWVFEADAAERPVRRFVLYSGGGGVSANAVRSRYQYVDVPAPAVRRVNIVRHVAESDPESPTPPTGRGVTRRFDRWGFGAYRAVYSTFVDEQYQPFDFGPPLRAMTETTDVWYAPHASLVVLTATLPALRLLGLLRARRRHGRGLCPTCGYDLRATPGRCPECGTSAAASPAAPPAHPAALHVLS